MIIFLFIGMFVFRCRMGAWLRRVRCGPYHRCWLSLGIYSSFRYLDYNGKDTTFFWYSSHARFILRKKYVCPAFGEAPLWWSQILVWRQYISVGMESCRRSGEIGGIVRRNRRFCPAISPILSAGKYSPAGAFIRKGGRRGEIWPKNRLKSFRMSIFFCNFEPC